MRKLRVITNSMVNSYLDCPRKCYLRNEVQIVARSQRIELNFGDSFHGGLDTYWVDGDWRGLKSLGDPFQDAKLRAMAKGYEIVWETWIHDHVDTIASELEFRVPLIDPDTGRRSTYWEVGGKIDKFAVVEKRAMIPEHKTASIVDSTYIAQLRINSQISTYLMAARSLGFAPPEGVLYDISKKPGIEPLQATPVEKRQYTKKDNRLYANQRDRDETPDEYYTRCLEAIGERPEEYYQHYEVVRLESEAHAAAQDLWFVAGFIHDSIVSGRWPRNTGACRKRNRLCEYFPICSGASNPEDQSMYEFKRANSELSE